MSLARQIVGFAIKAGSSDIHLEEGSPIAIRVNSDIRILENILGPNEMSSLLSEIVSEEKLQQYESTGDLDTSIGLKGYQESESMRTRPTKNAVRPQDPLIAFQSGKILASHNLLLISPKSIVASSFTGPTAQVNQQH